MIVVMRTGAKEEQIQRVLDKIHREGLKEHVSRGVERTIIGLVGDVRKIQKGQLEAIEGVDKVMTVLKPFKLASRDFHPEDTKIKINGITVGDKQVMVMAGPCAVESREQIIETAKAIKNAGAHILRGGAFKPRTSPYAFQGMGEEGLKLLAEAKNETGLPIITEAMDIQSIDLVAKYADIVQIGARNMQNFKLLKEVGKIDKPVMLKRGMSATLNEFLMSAEYIMSEGNEKVILCERGIRTFVEYSRNTLDLNIVPVLKRMTHLPVVVDPSHGTGKYEMVKPMAMASVAAGADGLMVEVHPRPEDAVSDGDQSLTFQRFEDMMKGIGPVAEAVGRSL